MNKKTLKKTLFVSVKIGLALAILGYLVWEARQSGEFQELAGQPKNWGLLIAAWFACAGAVTLTMVRWYFLVRAIGLPFTIRDAFRLGYLGYLFNLAPMGIVGGDLVKAVGLARKHPNHRAEAVATVALDRLIGLYTLFVVASIAIMATGFLRIADWTEARRIVGVEVATAISTACSLTPLLTAIATLVIAVLLMRDASQGRVTRLLARIPYAGQTISKLANAVKLYRRKRGVLLVAAGMSAAVHSLFTLGIFLIAGGLYPHVPSLSSHFVISPLSAATGVIPLPVGPFEGVLQVLYTCVPMGEGIVAPSGLIVALSYRIGTVLIAAIGICYYLAGRAEVAELLHESEEVEA